MKPAEARAREWAQENTPHDRATAARAYCAGAAAEREAVMAEVIEKVRCKVRLHAKDYCCAEAIARALGSMVKG